MIPENPGTDPRVLMIGPTPPDIGGMVSVMQNLLASSLADAAHLSVLPNNPPWFRSWGALGSVARHLALLGRLVHRTLSGRIDLAHIHTCSYFSFYRNLLDLALLRLLGCKVVLHLHGSRFADFYDGAGLLGRAAIRAGLNHAHAVIVLSEQWKQWVQRRAPGGRVIVILNGVPLPDRETGPPTRSGESCRFLYLGLLAEAKGLFDLLDAVVRLRDRGTILQLSLAGPWASHREQTRFRSSLRHQELENLVRYEGLADRRQCHRLYAEADAFVLPSHGEVMPLTVLEAMSRALPIVAANVGAVAELLDHGAAGLLVEPGDVDGLARAMCRLARHPTLRARLGRRARRRVADHYSDAAQADAVLRLYRSLAGGEPTPAVAPSP